MKSKDQQFLEEAYQRVREEYDSSQFDPRLNPVDPSNKPVADYKEPKDYLSKLKNQERNAGVSEEPFKSFSSPSKKLGQFYKTKYGKEFIMARSKYSGKVEPHSTTLVRGEDFEDGRYEVEYKITGIDDQGYPLEEPTGKKPKKLTSTQWGVKDVPGGDID